MIAGRVVCTLFIAILAVLIWKTAEYFNRLPENDKNKPLIAWDVLTLFLILVYLVVRLIVA
jgi:hypothetical protein